MDGLENLWADLLSGDTKRVLGAWSGLAAPERQSILDHLARMRDETGWHATQRESAAQALALLAGPAGNILNQAK